VNLAALDDDGGTLTTGWEAVGAIVTDVEYNFSDRTTQLTFSADQMETLGLDVQQLKDRLRIRPATLQFFFNFSIAYSWTKTANITTVHQSLESKWLDELGEEQ
jgi:hypothetical protein